MKEAEVCHHLEVTDDGVCIECGTDITTQEFVDSLPDVPMPSKASIGNIIGIVALAKTTGEEFLASQEADSPEQPKLCWIGTQMVRLPKKTMWVDYISNSYYAAKELGYRGSMVRWAEIVRDLMTPITEE